MVSDRKKNWHLDWCLGGLIFLLLIMRSCAYGVQYWPQLDDYIQYHNYAAGFTFKQLQELTGLLASRPLAGLADYYIWTPLFDHMILGVAVLSAMYSVCIVWLKRLMQRYVAVGPVFFVIMGLLPLGVEGTYWMSASTRIICGLFFACLTAKAFGRWLDRGDWASAIAFAIFMPIPFGFYEQSAVLAMTLVLGMAILELRKKGFRSFLAAWIIPAAGLYYAVTGAFATESVYSSRSELVLPVSDYYWDTFLPDILEQVKTVFLDANIHIAGKGFIRTIRNLSSGHMVPWFTVTVFICVLLFCLVRRGEKVSEKRNTLLALLIGVLLAAAPVTPFLILANPWFSLRGAVTSFAGIALVCDTIVMALWRILPAQKSGPAALAAVTALVFCMAGASEVGDYRDTYLDDQQAATLVLEQLKEDFSEETDAKKIRVGILGLEKSFLPDQNFVWHEHIHGCTESDWAFAGVMTCMDANSDRPSVTPLPTDPIYRRWNAESNRPQNFDALYWYDGTELIPVTLKQIGELEFEVWSASEQIGRIWEEEDEIGYFRGA